MIAFDQNGEDWECDSYSKLPMNLGGATGGTLDDGTVIVCGGYQGFVNWFENKCYVFPPDDVNVIDLPMTIQRYMASSIVMKGNSLLITGGYSSVE